MVKKNKNKLSGRRTVVMSNELIQASQGLDTIAKKRLISIAVSNINSKMKKKLIHFDDDFKFDITAVEYSRICKVDLGRSYDQIKKAANDLMSSDNVIKRKVLDKDGAPIVVKGKEQYEAFTWIQHILYCEGDGKVTITLSKRVTDFLCDLHKNYTYYLLEKGCRLKSVYTFRFFELMMQYYSTGWFLMSTVEFCRLMGAPETYCLAFQRIKERLILPVVKELMSDFTITWESLKRSPDKKPRGRKQITHVKFYFKENDQLSLEV